MSAKFLYHKSMGASEKPIIKALEGRGCTVHHTYRQGDGFPDLVVLVEGRVYLAEVKEGDQPLSPAQVEFHAKWPVAILRSVEDALRWVDPLLG